MGAADKEQFPCATEARLEPWMCEQDVPICFSAFTADHIGCVTPRQRADCDGVLAESIGRFDGKGEVAASDAAASIDSPSGHFGESFVLRIARRRCH